MAKILLTPETRIFAKNLKDGETIEITDNLYFFEEEGILELGETDHYGNHWEIWVELPESDRFNPLKTTYIPSLIIDTEQIKHQ